jgi:hypothetical protein
LTRAAIREPGVAAASPMHCGSSDEPEVLPERRGHVWDRRRQPWDVVYRRMTLVNAFGNIIGLSDRLRGTPLSISYRSQPSDVDGFLSGSCLAISRDAWNEIGPFDEEFFLYQEEAEWQRRATNAGWRLRLADEMVRHVAKGTVNDDPQRLTRSEDLAFASAVLLVEYCYGKFVAQVYLMVGALVSNLGDRRHGRRKSIHNGRDVVLICDGDPASVNDQTAAAVALLKAGFSVCVMSLGRLGSFPRRLPPAVRLIRRPWWWPSIAPEGPASYVVFGPTRRERVSARLFKLRHPRVMELAVKDLETPMIEARRETVG